MTNETEDCIVANTAAGISASERSSYQCEKWFFFTRRPQRNPSIPLTTRVIRVEPVWAPAKSPALATAIRNVLLVPFRYFFGCCPAVAAVDRFMTVLLAFLCATGNVEGVSLRCSPCIERPTFHVRGIVHGTDSSSFWNQVRSAALASARDLRVDFSMDLYKSFDPKRMASDIKGVVNSPDRPDALIVTIPSQEVEDAVRYAVGAGLHVFGLNSGYTVAKDLGVKGFVAMDEYKGGREAGVAFLSLRKVKRALFINQEQGNSAIAERFHGFRDSLRPKINSTLYGVEAADLQNNVVVDEISLFARSDRNDEAIAEALGTGCDRYDAVLLGGASLLQDATAAFYSNGCVLGSDAAPALATFDVNSAVYDAIAVGKLKFAISQQQYLQGILSVCMATLFVTTGKKLSSGSGAYLSGPAVITLKNLPSDTLQTCESDAFPLCPNTRTPDGSRESNCDCIERKRIKIGGVVHGVSTDEFWDQVFAASYQAADDMGIDLNFARFDPQETDDILHAKMLNKIISLCKEGVSGIFVSLPNDNVLPAIRVCLELNVPVVSINSGAQESKSLGLMHHIAQNEYQAGWGAGKRLIDAGMTRGACLNHMPGVGTMNERCDGFHDSLMEAGENATYLGMVYVPHDSAAQYKKSVRDAVDEEGDWMGVGLLLCGSSQVTEALEVWDEHPGVLIASFDTSNVIYDAIGSGKLLLGIDQESYLQGYMPVVLLTWFVYTGQKLANAYIESGPAFVESRPSRSRQTCEAKLFRVCPETVDYEMNQLDRIRPAGLILFSVVAATSLGFTGWVGTNRESRVVMGSQPIFLFMVCIGALIMGSAIIPLGIDDSVVGTRGCNIACMSVPWLFFMGFTVAFSALFSKTWRINRLMSNARMFKRVRIMPSDVILPFVILLLLNVALLLTWTLFDPMYWERKSSCGSSALETYGTCSLGTGGSEVIASCLVALNLFVVVLANFQAYKARHINMEFNESRFIGFVMVTILQISIIGLPVMFLVDENPQASYFVSVGLIFVLCMSILILIFMPKVFILRKRRRFGEQGQLSSNSTVMGLHFYEDGVGLNVFSRDGPSDSDAASRIDPKKIYELGQLLEEQGIAGEPLFEKVGIPLRRMRTEKTVEDSS